jgi:hypothetical protein
MAINQNEMYSENSVNVENALRELVTAPIKDVCKLIFLNQIKC